MAKKRSEVYYRINKEGLASILSVEANPESVYNMGAEDYDTQSIQTNQTTKTIVTTKTEQNFKIEVTEKTDYVLVDLRDQLSFEKFRIKEGTQSFRQQ